MTALALILAVLLVTSARRNARLKKELARIEQCHDVMQANWFRSSNENARLTKQLAQQGTTLPMHVPTNEEIEQGVW